MGEMTMSLLAVGNIDQFEVILDAIGERLSFQKRLSSPCTISVNPEHLHQSLKIVCDGHVMYGHIPYDVDNVEIVTTPIRMLQFLEELGYEVFLSPEFEACKLADEQPLTRKQELKKLAYEKEHAGVLY
jgi:hypothetical protein